MAKKKGVKKAIKAAASGGITKKELKSIIKSTGASASTVVQQADKINKKAKAKGGTPFVSLNSGAANMLIKQAGKVTNPYLQPSYGDGRIGKTLQSMIGSPASSGTYIQGQRVGATQGTPASLMIGGTQIRPGGRVAVQGFGSSPRATGLPSGAAPVTVDPTDTDEYWSDRSAQAAENRADRQQDTGLDFQSIIDALSASEPMPSMPDYSSMFSDMFDQVSSEFDVPDPLQLAALGRAYGADMIRARQRQRKTRSDYLRNRMNLALGGTQGMAPMSFGGGLTL